MPQGYICIFAKADEPNISRIEYATDWRAKLNDINSNFYSDTYYCYAVLEVLSEEDYDTLLNDVIDKLNPGLRKQANKSFYNIPPKDLYDILKGIIKLSISGNNLKSVNNWELDTQAKKSEVKTTTDSPKGDSVKKESTSLKDIAIRLLKKDGIEKGYKLSDELVSYSRKVKNYNNYWVTPSSKYFEQNWSLILHDEGRKAFYLFNIPAFALKPDLFAKREDADQYNIYIDYNDPHFADVNYGGSGFKFRKFLVAILQYSDSDLVIEEPKQKEVIKKPERPIEKPKKVETTPSQTIVSRPIEQTHPKTEEEFKKSIVFYTLSEHYNATYSVPTSVTLNNIEYEVDNYIDVLEYIILHILEIDRRIVYDLASDNCKEYKSQPYLSLNQGALASPHNVHKTDLYIEENLTPNQVLDFSRWLCAQANLDASKIYYNAYKISF